MTFENPREPAEPGAYVYVDESKDGEGKKNFLFAAVIVQIPQHDRLTTAWESLQTSIRNHMRTEYMARKGYKKWQEDELKPEKSHILPEIHAQHMVGSAGHYEKYLDKSIKDDHYWHQHIDWLEEAFKVQIKFNLPVFMISGLPQLNDPARRGSLALSKAIENGYKANPSIIKSIERYFPKMNRLQANPYTTAVPQILFNIESELARRNVFAEVIFDDDGSDLKAFRNSDLIAKFCGMPGVFPHITGVDFKDSSTVIGLQIADIHAFTAWRTESVGKKFISSNSHDIRIENFAIDYTDKQSWLCSPSELTDNQIILKVAISNEYCIRSTINDKTLSDTIVQELNRAAGKLYNIAT
jgi:hypothetical protein